LSDRHDPGSLDAAVTSYLTSKYFTELAPGTQRMRRNLHARSLSALATRASAPELENRVIHLASLGISAEASGARTGAETVMVGEFGIEAAFIVAPGTPPQ
jgi:hypothetical protein